MKPERHKKLALVRGKFLNKYEMQSFAPLAKQYDIRAFGSLTCYHDTFAFPVTKLLSPMDVPEFPLNMPVLNRLFVDAHYLFGLENQLKGFDIVHTAETYYHYTQQALDAKKKGYVKKVVATVLENIPFNNEGIRGRKQFKARSRKELDHIIALTQKTKRTLVLEGASPKKITVIGHGIDTKIFTPDKDHFRKLGASDGHILTILFSGRLESYKGVFVILDAAKSILEDKSIRQSIRFIFVGTGSEKKTMLSLEKSMGIQKSVVHMDVPYEQMPDVYKTADIFVAPSMPNETWEEQYCTALLEAQSMGLPIVTTKSGGIPENVGLCALFSDIGDSQSLAREVKKFILHPTLRVHYGRKARERAIKVHDTSIIAKKLDMVYQSLFV